MLKRNANHKKPNAMIIVERTKKRIFCCVPERKIPQDSFPKDYGNIRLHVLGLNKSGVLWPIIPHREIVENETPTDLFMAKHCAAEVEEVYGLSVPLTEKIKLGIFIGLIVAILMVIFMMAMSAGGPA